MTLSLFAFPWGWQRRGQLENWNEKGLDWNSSSLLTSCVLPGN